MNSAAETSALGGGDLEASITRASQRGAVRVLGRGFGC